MNLNENQQLKKKTSKDINKTEQKIKKIKSKNEEKNNIKNNIIINNKNPSKNLIVENFILVSEIGHGSFGKIFLSYNLRENTEVAIKKEIKSNQKKSQLENETKIYENL